MWPVDGWIATAIACCGTVATAASAACWVALSSVTVTGPGVTGAW